MVLQVACHILFGLKLPKADSCIHLRSFWFEQTALAVNKILQARFCTKLKYELPRVKNT